MLFGYLTVIERRKILAMTATMKLVELAMSAKGLTSEYQLSKALGISAQRVAHWRIKGTECDDETALALAEMSGLSAEYALTLLAASRAKSPRARATFTRIAERLAA